MINFTFLFAPIYKATKFIVYFRFWIRRNIKNYYFTEARVRDSSEKPTAKRNEMEFCEDL